ncbi:MAG TPA: hypothetical protein VFX23_00135 [Limnobacter sp.]|uniref:hypothetical protein n=1 Tax=Limnobacter sp. TaxID=2003368 RepID=UPI002E2EBF11|nr:hypothetical protein [Limnobacter sp.]HEX5484378.1 hypothetical protein [Limnobacter sp.]
MTAIAAMLLFLFVVFGGTAWSVFACWRAIKYWSGIWLLMPVLLLANLAFVVIQIIVDTSVDPTSHNLWPFELLLADLLCASILTPAAWLKRRFFNDD